jgi:1-acyl-sn-glycerol-3-phosphate acyltransferase
VLIFPEGRYSRGRELRPLKKGVAHFALQAGVPICPVAIAGLDRFRLFGQVLISVGPPIRPDPPRWWGLSRQVVEVVDRVRRSILRAFGREPGSGAERRRGRMLGRLARRLRRLRRSQPRLGAEAEVGPSWPPPT